VETTAESRSDPGTPTGTPTTSAACGGADAGTGPGTSWDVQYGRAAGFEVRASDHAVALGDPLTVRLTNVSDEPRSTGVERKFDVHRDVGNLTPEWESIYRFPGNHGFRDEPIGHDPGEGFVWRFQLTPEGMEYDRHFRVCEPLEPGAYRFVFRGSAGPRPLGVQFEVVGTDR